MTGRRERCKSTLKLVVFLIEVVFGQLVCVQLTHKQKIQKRIFDKVLYIFLMDKDLLCLPDFFFLTEIGVMFFKLY